MKAYLSLGSNIGFVLRHLKEACEYLDADHNVEIIKKSSIYHTEPIGIKGRWFANQVVEIKTTYNPYELFELTCAIEKLMGRVRKGDKSPRTIDIDIIACDDIIIKEKELQIPHKRMCKRLFVLEPLFEIVPKWQHPVTGESIEILTRKLKSLKKPQKIYKMRLA